MSGSTSKAFCDRVEGRRVRSIDARIHQPFSSSCKTTLDFSVSMESMVSPLEKLLPHINTKDAKEVVVYAASAYLLGEVDHTLRQSYLPQLLILFLFLVVGLAIRLTLSDSS